MRTCISTIQSREGNPLQSVCTPRKHRLHTPLGLRNLIDNFRLHVDAFDRHNHTSTTDTTLECQTMRVPIRTTRSIASTASARIDCSTCTSGQCRFSCVCVCSVGVRVCVRCDEQFFWRVSQVKKKSLRESHEVEPTRPQLAPRRRYTVRHLSSKDQSKSLKLMLCS